MISSLGLTIPTQVSGQNGKPHEKCAARLSLLFALGDNFTELSVNDLRLVTCY